MSISVGCSWDGTGNLLVADTERRHATECNASSVLRQNLDRKKTSDGTWEIVDPPKDRCCSRFKARARSVLGRDKRPLTLHERCIDEVVESVATTREVAPG